MSVAADAAGFAAGLAATFALVFSVLAGLFAMAARLADYMMGFEPASSPREMLRVGLILALLSVGLFMVSGLCYIVGRALA